MGIGGEFKFDFMKEFSDFSCSRTENITPQSDAQEVFNQIYNNTVNTYLKKVFINVFFNQNVRDVNILCITQNRKI